MTEIRAIRIDRHGGPDVMSLKTIDLGEPGPGQVRIRHGAIGVNFIDTYHRSGLYPVPLPSGLGLEGAGVVEAIGKDVSGWQIGDRAAYATGPLGSYAEANIIPADHAVKLPDGISDELAAAIMVKGITAQFLLRQTYRLKPGDTVLFHAAAGGVGLIACQWAKYLGATVIGTAGSEEKAALARSHGCDHVLRYREEDVPKKVRELTNGVGVDVVYDGVGKDTFSMSLDSLKIRGLLVSFGNASGPVTGVDLGILSAKGSLYVTRPTLFHYAGTKQQLQACADDIFAVLQSGAVKTEIHQRNKLADAVQVHKDLESRKTTGATIMTP